MPLESAPDFWAEALESSCLSGDWHLYGEQNNHERADRFAHCAMPTGGFPPLQVV